MCRLYGFVGTEPTRLECSLVESQNALQVQSDRDGRGVRNADGWGVAEWDGSALGVHRNTHPAFADQRFVTIASAVSSRMVIAHVRAATVGAIAVRNTHPFTYGPWGFAHNGALTPLAHVATHLDLGEYGPPEGETDSELVFRWMLNRMEHHGLDPETPAPALEPILDLVEDAVLELVRIAVAAGGAEPPRLNFLLGDGAHLVASRWGNSLHWTHRRGITDCSVCGTSHCPSAGPGYRAVAIASEPLTDEAWIEVPDGTVLGVDAEARTTTRNLVDATGVA